MRKGTQNYINAGSLFFFSNEVAAAFRDDVLMCMLAGQLVASGKHQKHKEYAAWRQTYLHTLTRLRLDTAYRNVESIPVETEGSIWTDARQELLKRVSPELVERATRILEGFSANTQDLGISALLHEQTTQLIRPARVPEPDSADDVPDIETPPLSNVVLQLGFIDVQPFVHLILLSFDSHQPCNMLPFSQLFTQVNRAGNLDMTVVSVKLEQDDFSSFRTELIERLGPRREQLIKLVSEVSP